MSLQRKTKLVILFVLVCISGASIAFKIAYKPHTSIEDRKIEYKGSSSELVKKVSANSEELLNKALLVMGKVEQIDENGIVLNNGIYCQLLNTTDKKEFTEGSEVMIKGRFIGYDDLLEEVKLDQCLIIEKK